MNFILSRDYLHNQIDAFFSFHNQQSGNTLKKKNIFAFIFLICMFTLKITGDCIFSHIYQRNPKNRHFFLEGEGGGLVVSKNEIIKVES